MKTSGIDNMDTMELTKNELQELQAIAEKPRALSPNHVRFSDAIWYDPNFSAITVGGAGGIGSWLSLLLSRAGYYIIIFDLDNVDETNMAGQLYTVDSIGQSKSQTIADLCSWFGAYRPPMSFTVFTDGSTSEPIAFATFDNMKARRLLFEAWKKRSDRKLFVDGRMLAEAGQVYFVTPETQDAYETQLFDDKDVMEQPCSMKATSFCGAHIASLMVTGLVNYVSNVKLNGDVREVPFKIEFELPLFNYTFKSDKECLPLITDTQETLKDYTVGT